MLHRLILPSLALFLMPSVALAQPTPFPTEDLLRGDANNDGVVNLADSTFITNYLYLHGPQPLCMDAADVNDDGQVDTSDSIYLNNYLFLGGPAPKQPFPACGQDPTNDSLSCVQSLCSI